MVKVREDLTGQRFGRLIVITKHDDYIDKNNYHRKRWLCQCDCGSEPIVVWELSLLSQNTKSCGCLQKEMTSKAKTKYNKYDVDTHEYGVCWTFNTNTEFYFDLEDYDLIKNYCWSERVTKKGHHVLRARDKASGKIFTMAILLGFKNHDHINRNPLDNRKSNLRPATKLQNGMNKSLSSNNTSGIIGVSLYKKDMTWEAYIGIENKTKHLGRYINKSDAIKAILEAEAKYFGEFAPQKHLFKQYNIKQQQPQEGER